MNGVGRRRVSFRSTGTQRRAGLLTAVLIVASAGCAGPGPAPAEPTESPAAAAGAFAAAPCPTPNVAGIPQLDLGPEFTCGFLTVPENRSRPDGRTIRIAVARVGATSPNPPPDPVVWLAGGPGGTAVATAALRVREGLNRDRENIFIDQRGTLHADPLLSCPEIDAFMVEALGMATSDPATTEKSNAATRACRDRLSGLGFDLAAYTRRT